MSGSDFFWGSVTGSAIQKGTDDLMSARETAQRTAERRENIEREKQFQKTFRAASAKMDELRELLREAHGERDVNAASEENFKLRFQLLESEFKKLHPDSEAAEATIKDIKKQGYAREIQFLKDKGYEIAK